MQVVLSFMAIGAFFLVSAIIETLVEGHSSSGNTLKNNKRLNRRRG
ncbi:MAG TPA: hypothetical protein V6D11_27620 [Waterburya sp.]|jgi:hypothetical protein